MQSNDPTRSKFSTISIEDDAHSQDGWDGSEDIELGSEEHDLLLKDNYIQLASNDMLPFESTSSPTPASQRSDRQDGPQLSRTQSFKRDNNNYNNDAQRNQHDQQTTFTTAESFQLDDSGRDSTISSSIIYQMPNYNQFAGNLAPSSPNSVLISLIMILLILSVTILPKILLESQQQTNDPFDDVIENNMNNSTTAQVHSDVRCKCICPPLSSHSPDKNSTNNTVINTTERRLYVGNTLPGQCNCNNIVQPHFAIEAMSSFKDFCARCECRYQSRNTMTIRRNVIFFIAVLTGLILYMLAQYLLKYFRITRRSLPRHLKWLSHQMTEG